ncbi:MAG: C1 family peptidase [Dehalococcoidia bacterium]|jgi:hypothetical protein|nr:C1 family peptidase [Dehalococcoidia bacterium]
MISNKCALVAIAVVAVILGTVNADEEQGDEWDRWSTKYHKTYPVRSERDTRRENFMQNLAVMRRLAAEFSDVGFELGSRADLSSDEFERTMLGFRMAPEADTVGYGGTWMPPPINAGVLPASVAYHRQPGVVGSVVDQGDCGSCWAVSVTSMCEATLALFGNESVPGEHVDLSMQQVLDCAQGWGCGGGDTAVASEYVVGRGLMTEADYPYVAVVGQCRYNATRARARYPGFVRIPRNDEAALARALVERGPLVVAIDASSALFRFYSSGTIMDRRCGTRLNHAVLLVGYTPTAWVLQNSWGQDWGAQGYVQIGRNAGNLCGIAAYAVAINH